MLNRFLSSFHHPREDSAGCREGFGDLLGILAAGGRAVRTSAALAPGDRGDRAEELAAEAQLLLWREIALYAERDRQPDKRGIEQLSALKAMISCVHERYGEKLTLSDIAAAGAVSKRTCGMLFSRYIHKTPLEFLTDYRLRRSTELLEREDASILDIALTVGFSGASYYAETFRKRYGMTPSEYRHRT